MKRTTLASLFVSFVLFCGYSALGDSVLPQPIAGWHIELIGEAPRIRHPSVVACAPDGRVFVAEDPMDISLPKADATEGRILCIHPDGGITVFAEKLYAVFGMQYLEVDPELNPIRDRPEFCRLIHAIAELQSIWGPASSTY